MTSRAITILQIIKKHDEYGTPKELFYQACLKYKINPLVDVCASKYNHVLPNYITKEQNSLGFEWNFDFFLNPPYSEVKTFVGHAYKSFLKYNVNALILTYAKTDTKFWHQFVEGKAETHFIEGRIKFLNEFGLPTKNSAPYPSCWIIYRSV